MSLLRFLSFVDRFATSHGFAFCRSLLPARGAFVAFGLLASGVSAMAQTTTTVTVCSNDTRMGTVTIVSPSGFSGAGTTAASYSKVVAADAAVTIKATPAVGFRFVRWEQPLFTYQYSGGTDTATSYQFTGSGYTEFRSAGLSWHSKSSNTEVQALFAPKYFYCPRQYGGYGSSQPPYVNETPGGLIKAVFEAVPVKFSFGNLTQAYDGTKKTVTVTTDPTGIPYTGTVTGGPAPGKYDVSVSATSPYAGSATGKLEITKAGQFIAFGNPSTQIYGFPVTLTNVSARSLKDSSLLDLPVTLTVMPTNPDGSLSAATLVGKTVIPTKEGNVTIRATQPGNDYYAAAAPVDITFLFENHFTQEPTLEYAGILTQGSNKELALYVGGNYRTDGTLETDGYIDITAKIKDVDGNLIRHTLGVRKHTWDAANNRWDDPPFVLVGNTTDQPTPNRTESVKSVRFAPSEPGFWEFHTTGTDGIYNPVGKQLTLWVYGSRNDADCLETLIDNTAASPRSVAMGASMAVSVRLMNIGDRPWQSGDSHPHSLKLVPEAADVWGINTVPMKAGDVADPFNASKATYKFEFTATAPTIPGIYRFQWRMHEAFLNNPIAYFGEATPEVAISVPPGKPVGLVADPIGFNALTLSWTSATGVTAWEVFRKDSATYTSLGKTTSPTFTVASLTQDTPYTFVVKAEAGAGNTSPYSDELPVRTTLDPQGDADNDGMKNQWEIDNGFDPRNAADATADFDHDGVNNLDEFRNGTDPRLSNSAELVGTLPGDLSVDNKGSANYSLPLSIPAGRAGMAPKLSLNYSSAAGNGPLGLGFSLSTGFPQAISRGRTILARDGKTRGVTFDDTNPDPSLRDKLYLDGKRLICTSGDTTYGRPGSTYRTEVDSFVTVTATGSGDNIETFVVTDKSGTKMTFGKYAATTDGYHAGILREVVGDPPRLVTGAGGAQTYVRGNQEVVSRKDSLAYTWALKRVEDAVGNGVTFTYGDTDGEYPLATIEYTNNSLTGAAPAQRIRLLYNQREVEGNATGDTSRSDRSTQYIAGRSFALRNRLDQILAETDNAIVAHYDLKYRYSPKIGTTRLISLGAAFRDPHSLAMRTVQPTAFGWEENTVKYRTICDPDVAIQADSEPSVTHAFADVNGDGLDDFVDFRIAGAISVSLSNGSGFEDPINWVATRSSLWTGPRFFTQMCDINGDGLKDIIYLGDGLCALVSSGASFVPLGGGDTTKSFYLFDDEFSDPPAEIPTDGSRNASGGCFFSNAEGVGCYRRISVADFNGDGLDDVLIHRYDGRLQVLRSTGSDFSVLPLVNVGARPLRGYANWEYWPGLTLRYLGFTVTQLFQVSPMPCDLNGDGLVDYVWTEKKVSWDWAQSLGAAITYVGGENQVYSVLSLPSGGFSPVSDGSRSSWSWRTGVPMPGETRAVLPHRANAFLAMPVDINGDGLIDIATILPADEDKASVYNNGAHQSSRQRILRLDVSLSSGSGGMSAGSVPDMIYPAGAPAAPISLKDGISAYPWYDRVLIGQWSNDYYEEPDRMKMITCPARTEAKLYASGLSDGDVVMTDLNGDGKADYVWYCDTTGATGWWVMYGQGEKFSAPEPAPLDWVPTSRPLSGSDLPNISTRTSLEINGDGIPDYAFCLAPSDLKPGVQGFHISQGSQGLRLKSITDGLKRVTEITYKPITDDSVYTPGAAVTYPIRELRNATYVVSDVEKDTGSTDAAGRAHFSYQYSGNRLDLSGRGGLGFHSFVTLDRQTKLFKYQFLTQSFPMTGLTAREQTYRYSEQGSTVNFRLVNSHDNTVVFDEVSNGSGGKYGTVYPFISQAIEYRWEDSSAAPAHFSWPRSDPRVGPSTADKPASAEGLFSEARPAGAHIAISAKSWFDNQSLSAEPQTTLPGGLFNANDRSTDWASAGVNKVYGSTEYKVSGLGLPGLITYGNLTKLKTDFGDGFSEMVETTYKTPVGSLTGLVDTVKTTVGWKENGTDKSAVAPLKSYTYWGSTPLVATETVDAGAAGVTAADSKLSTTTSYARDDRGRVTKTTISGYNNPGGASASVLGTLEADDNKALHIGTIATADSSFADDFDGRWDLPKIVRNAYPYLYTTTTEYDPFLGLPLSVKDVNGAETKVTYDALGRKVKVVDVLKGLETRSSIAWTDKDTATDWTKPQPVTPPTLPNASAPFNGVAPDSGIENVKAIAAKSSYAIRTIATVQAPVTAYYDRLGRVIRTVKEGFNGQLTYTDTVYNTLGQTVAVSLPYNPSDPTTGPFWTTTTYDALGRVATVTAPNGTVTTNSYRGRITQVTVDAANLGGVDPAPQTNTTFVDAKGRTIKVWNADNLPALAAIDATTPAATSSTTASLEYKLDGFGRMRETVLKDQTQTVKATYDALGRQLTLDDPDKGLWTYVNNALGHVVKQTDAKGTVTRSTFDRLGRPLSRQTTEAGGPVETADWYYYSKDTLDHLHTVDYAEQGWIGAPQREMSQTTGAPGYGDPGTASIHYYDPKGRPSLNLNQVDGKFFYTAHEYDQYSRPQAVRHFWRPAGEEDPKTPYYWNDWGYTYQYDSESYLLSLRDTAGRTWWQADTASGYDHLDRPVRVRKGDGHWTVRTYRPTDGLLTGIKTGPTLGSTAIQNLTFSYDGLGNLKQRQDLALGKTEDFTYDTLNRLLTGGMGYAANGNITAKGAVDGTSLSNYQYSPTKPHAVTGVTATLGGVTNTYHYGYDFNGNLTTRERREGGVLKETWSTRWAGFDKPRWLAKTDSSSGTAKTTGSEFLYNANRSRVVHLEFDALSGTGATATPSHYARKKVYGLGPQLEADYVNTTPLNPSLPQSLPTWALDKIRIYVPGPEGIVGTMEFAPRAPFGQAEKSLVYHYDHLGSIERITPYGDTGTAYVLDGDGKPSRYSYDAWGQRRNADTWSGKPPVDAQGKATLTANGGSNDATPRGFTGHEMLDDLGLVHMNGRIYDPLLGRFLSADILVQNAGDLQAYNRYAYVRNNPVSLNDPSGHVWSAIFTVAFAAVDTYQYATGKISGTEYAANMALNGAALVADVATLGQGGGLAVRAANIAIKTAKAIDRANDAYQTVQGVAGAVEATGELASKVVEGNASLADVGNAALNVASAVVDVKSHGKGPEIPAEKMHVSRLDGSDVSAKRVEVAPKTPAAQDTKGGFHSETTKPPRDGQDSHHMPARESIGDAPDNVSLSIKMDHVDHVETSSHGSSQAAAEFRDAQGELWNSGDAASRRTAMATEIRDVRDAARTGSGDATKYNERIQEMLKKAKDHEILPDNPKRP